MVGRDPAWRGQGRIGFCMRICIFRVSSIFHLQFRRTQAVVSGICNLSRRMADSSSKEYCTVAREWSRDPASHLFLGIPLCLLIAFLWHQVVTTQLKALIELGSSGSLLTSPRPAPIEGQLAAARVGGQGLVQAWYGGKKMQRARRRVLIDTIRSEFEVLFSGHFSHSKNAKVIQGVCFHPWPCPMPWSSPSVPLRI